MHKTLLLLGLMLPLAGPLHADPKHMLDTSGEWTLYRDEAYDIAWKNGQHSILSNVCVAETVQVQTTVDLVALPAGAQPEGDLPGQILIRVSNPEWGYGQHWDQLWVQVMNSDHKVGKGLFNGTWITAPLGAWADQGNPFAKAASIWGEEITFKNRQKEDLAAVRAGGLNAIYPALLRCAAGQA